MQHLMTRFDLNTSPSCHEEYLLKSKYCVSLSWILCAIISKTY